MRRYYDDSYTTHFTAQVIERLQVGDNHAVILDQTYFYPTSGGQPNDKGEINFVPVIDVISREDGAVVHVLTDEFKDNQASSTINWVRRFDHMQHHTGQHILSQAFIQFADANTVGFHMSDDSMTVDLDKVNLPTGVIDLVEDLANEVVFANRPVTARIISLEEAAAHIRMRKLPEKIHTDGLRIIDIDGFDVTACGGTHVKQTGEIGMIKVLRTEKRGDKTRVEFRCGGRALEVFSSQNTLVNQLTAHLTCKADEVFGSITRMQDEIKTAQRDLKAAKSQLIEAEAERLIAQTPIQNDLRVVIKTITDMDVSDIRLLASKLVQTPGVIALLGAAGDKAQMVFARSEGLKPDMNALIKTALAVINGRGGGQANMAQGGGVPATTEQVSAALEVAAGSIR